MRDNKYVYPVLGNADDIIPGIIYDEKKPTVELVGEDSKECRFCVSMEFDNDDIKSLINDGYAMYTCDIYCRRTRLRRIVSSKENNFVFSVKKSEVFNVINFTPQVTVIKPISNYRNSQQNEDYGDMTFSLEEGDILAIFKGFSYCAEYEEREIYNAGSFVKIYNGKDKQFPWSNIDGEIIKIYLPKDEYNNFMMVRNDRRMTDEIHAGLITPFLYKAIIDYQEEKHGNYRWAYAIKYRLYHDSKFKGYDLSNKESAFELTQLLLGKPVKRMLDKMSKQNKI